MSGAGVSLTWKLELLIDNGSTGRLKRRLNTVFTGTLAAPPGGLDAPSVRPLRSGALLVVNCVVRGTTALPERSSTPEMVTIISEEDGNNPYGTICTS